MPQTSSRPRRAGRPGRPGHTARLVGLALVLPTSLGLVACSADDVAPTAAGTAPAAGQPVTDGQVLRATNPLTGQEITRGRSTRAWPVLVTKIDNTPSSSPQLGLSRADLVVEELVEGGVTRLAAFYWSRLPEVVGPVRSMRASDIGIVSPAGASIVTSGAAQRTIRRIDGAGITFYEEGATGIYRDYSRYAPYNLFADLTKVGEKAAEDAAEAGEDVTRPGDYLPWAEPGSARPAGARATTVAADFGQHTTTWAYARGRYANTDSEAAEGDRFRADNVLVLRVRTKDAGYRDPGGNYVPETILEGTGKAVLFTGGRAVTATWSKDSVDAPVTLRAGDGELLVPPGRTWVELVPATGGAVTYR